jgi:hypothetical protein
MLIFHAYRIFLCTFSTEGGLVNSIPKHKTLDLEKSRFLGLLVLDTLTFSTLQYKMTQISIL